MRTGMYSTGDGPNMVYLPFFLVGSLAQWFRCTLFLHHAEVPGSNPSGAPLFAHLYNPDLAFFIKVFI